MILRQALSSTFIQILINISHLIFGLSLAFFFGAQKEMDAYVTASNFIISLNALFTSSQAGTFIPFISKYKDNPDKKEILSSVIKSNFFLFTFLALLINIFSNKIVFVLAPGLNSEQLILASNILRILSFYLVFANVCYLGSALLDYNYKFEKRYFLSLVQSLICLLCLFFFIGKFKIYSPAIAYVFSFLIISIIYLQLLFRSGLRIKTPVGVYRNHIKEYFFLLLPIMFSQFFIWMIRFSDVFIASFLKSGSISYLGYCQRMNLYVAFVSTVICTIYFPILSKLVGHNDKKAFLNTFYKGLQVLALIVFGIGSFIFLFSHHIIGFLFERGAFNQNDTETVSIVLKFYILVLICAPFGTYFSNAYFSYHNTKLAMIYSVISSTTNIILNIILGYLYGLFGLALASSIAFLCGNIFQITNIKKVNSEYNLLMSIKNMAKPFLAAALCLCITAYILTFDLFVSFENITISRFINLSIYFTSYLILYLVINLVIKTESVVGLLSGIKGNK